MNPENMFEVASRQKFRFDSKVGLLSIEDLWSLPLKSNTKASLDGIAIELHRQLKGSEESFVSETSKDQTLELKFEIVKHIIKVRMAENQAVVDRQKREAQRDQINSLIARKQNENLESLSLEELQAIANSL